MTDQSPKMIRNPFTGKMEPYTPRVTVDLITPRKLTEAQKVSETERVSFELARLRSKYADLGQKKFGPRGDKLMQQYRHLSLEYRTITGEKPPSIDADL